MEKEPLPFQLSYRVQQEKRGVLRYVFLIVSVLTLLVIGICSSTFGNLNQSVRERQEPTIEFAKQIFSTGLPEPGADIWSRDFEFDPIKLGELENIVRRFGEPTQIHRAECRALAMLRVDGSPGSWIFCIVQMSFDQSRGSLQLTWRDEARSWKIAGISFFFDMSRRAHEPENITELEPQPQYPAKMDPKDLSRSILPDVNLPDD